MIQHLTAQPNTSGEYRFIILADVHVGLRRSGFNGHLSSQYLRAAMHAVNDTQSTDHAVSAVLDLGDFSDRKQPDIDKNTQEYAQAISILDSNIAYAFCRGNHETEMERRLRILREKTRRTDVTADSTLIDAGSARIFMYSTDILAVNSSGSMIIPQSGIELYEQVARQAAADGKALITCSHPGFTGANPVLVEKKIQSHSDIPNYQFNEGKYHFKNAYEVQNINSRFNNHALGIGGHRHTLDFFQNSLTLPAFSAASLYQSDQPCATLLDVRIKPEGLSAEFVSVTLDGQFVAPQVYIPDHISQAIKNISFQQEAFA